MGMSITRIQISILEHTFPQKEGASPGAVRAMDIQPQTWALKPGQRVQLPAHSKRLASESRAPLSHFPARCSGKGFARLVAILVVSGLRRSRQLQQLLQPGTPSTASSATAIGFESTAKCLDQNIFHIRGPKTIPRCIVCIL